MTLIVASLRSTFPLKDLLVYFGLSRSTFYYCLAHPQKDCYIKERKLIKTVFEQAKGRYGYRRVALVLRKEHDICLDRKTVAKIMREEGLVAKQRRRSHYSSYKGTVGKVATNHLKRDFDASQPFQKLVTDITQFKVGTSWVYLSPLIDLFNGEVVSWSIGTRPDMRLVCSMLIDVYELLCRHRPIVHSDQGLQYQKHQWLTLLLDAGCRPSMSRKGNCLDNAVAESFFGKVKTEFGDGSDYRDVRTFIARLDEYIRWYNEVRIKEVLTGLSPVEYRILKTHQPWIMSNFDGSHQFYGGRGGI